MSLVTDLNAKVSQLSQIEDPSARANALADWINGLGSDQRVIILKLSGFAPWVAEQYRSRAMLYGSDILTDLARMLELS